MEEKKLSKEWESLSEEERAKRIAEDPLLALAGTGKHFFVNETPDEYVRRMREGWGTFAPHPAGLPSARWHYSPDSS